MNSESTKAWTASGKQPRIAIIGSGLSGLGAVVHLRRAGYTDLTVFEKAESLGGTWRDNCYPGLNCDIASYWYSFTFAPNPHWSHRYPKGHEVRAYLEKVADDFDIRRIIRFKSPVQELQYEAPRWRLRCEEAADSEAFDIVISATGILHHPKLPDIPGLSDFKGVAFHSSRWRDDAPISGKRVGVIGTGSTSAQIVGALGEPSGKLSVFQRTPQWMFPLPQKQYSEIWKAFAARFPIVMRYLYWWHRQLLERTLGPATMGSKLWQAIYQRACLQNIHKTVKDPELRKKLTPDYKAACKRLVICSTFYPAMVRDNVELVTDGIAAIEPKGIRTQDGRLHELDTLILCTGFYTNRFILPVNVVGEDGRRLADVWGEAPRAHRAMSVPGFPNLWFLQGPTGPVGNISLVSVSEMQIKYIVQCLNKMKEEHAVSMQPTQSAFEAYNADLKTFVKKTIWATGGCQSWYIDASGDPNLYSHPPQQFYRDMKRPVFSEYLLKKAEQRRREDRVVASREAHAGV